MDNGANWDIKIPAGLVNLISVGPDHNVHVKAGLPQYQTGLASAPTTNGAVTLDASVSAGTFVMTATANPDHTSTGNRFILKVNQNGTSGTAYALDGETLQTDLASTYSMSATTSINLDEVVDYRFTLTER
jgi:isoaspartyl peptidase/L-asparaginase-like protein (Ntn-hydrolase superfamily)